MKKAMSLLLAAAMTLSLAACGSSNSGTTTGNDSSNTTSDNSGAAEGATYQITMATAGATGGGDVACGNKFVELVDEMSNGRIKVTFHTDGTLGTEMENIQQIKTGEIQMTVLGDNFCSQVVTGLDPTVIPFTFKNADDVKAVYSDETLGKMIADAAKDNANSYLIGLNLRSPRLLTASKEIKTPDQLKGIKLRLPEIEAHVKVWSSLGAMPTVVALAETYSALQTGVVDAQENPIDYIYSNKFYEVNKYIMKTEHIQGLFHWLVNADFYDSMAPEDQKILSDALTEACNWADSEMEKQSQECWDKILAGGDVTAVDVDKEVWIEAAQAGVQDALSAMDPAAQEYVANYLNK